MTQPNVQNFAHSEGIRLAGCSGLSDVMRASGDLASTAGEVVSAGASLSPFLSADNFLVARSRTSWNMVEIWKGWGNFKL